MSQQTTDNTIPAAGNGIAQPDVAHPVAQHATQNEHVPAHNDAHGLAVENTQVNGAPGNDAQADVAPAPTTHPDAVDAVLDATTMSREDIDFIKAVLEVAYNTAFTSAHDATHVGTGEALNAFAASNADIRAVFNLIRDILPVLEARLIGVHNFLFAAAIRGSHAFPPNAPAQVERSGAMRRRRNQHGQEGAGEEQGGDETGIDGTDFTGEGGDGEGEGDADGAGTIGMA